MAYPQDLVGKYVDFKLDMGMVRSDGQDRVLDGPLIGTAGHAVYLGHPVAPSGKIQVQPAAGAPPWNFAFLKYMTGTVTTTRLVGGVMTGPMSGCYLCKYTQAGTPKLAHIGTAHQSDTEDSIQAKAAWRALVASPGVGAVTGGSPFDYFSVADQRNGGFQQSPAQIVGFFDAGVAWAILVAPIPADKNSLNRPLMRVAAAKQMTLQPWSTIAAMRRFRS